MTFRVGQKVVCVDDVWPDDNKADFPLIEFPVAGRIYTIRWVGYSPTYAKSYPYLSCRVEELKSKPFITDPEGMTFKCSRFRPVVSTSTGMAILESIRRDVSNHILRPVREDA